MLIDLRRVPRLDARAADTLVRLARRAPGHVRLVLLSPAPSALIILRALRLEAIFEIHEDAAEVLRAAG
ncbi:STAS domain-containing protein [Corallococcus sp. M7]